jgi:hypothetical protein
MTAHGVYLTYCTMAMARRGELSAERDFEWSSGWSAGDYLLSKSRRRDCRVVAWVDATDQVTHIMVGQMWSTILNAMKHPVICAAAGDTPGGERWW